MHQLHAAVYVLLSFDLKKLKMMNPHKKMHGVFSMTVICWWLTVVVADPQINLLQTGCSPFGASKKPGFYSNLNATMSKLREQLNNNEKFATAEQVTGPAYVNGMVQCRNYLSTPDCLACFTTAFSQIIRNCSTADGARIIYDGCFLRYESSSFYNQTTEPGNKGDCGNQTTSQPNAFSAAVKELLADLQVATPRIKGFFAASKKEVVGGDGNATVVGGDGNATVVGGDGNATVIGGDGNATVIGGDGNATVYAVAQCVETISENGCRDCLTVAATNAELCLPYAVARAVDAGCFLRYSNTPFFADNQTTNILPFLRNGSSSKKKAIIAGVVGGVAGAILIIAFFVWFTILRRRKPVIRGDILGATELRGPVNYKYKDLKAATKNFSEENKLGEGGFGDVYKGTLKNGKIVAVKKLAIGRSSRAKADFESEVKLISNVHHRNMIRLLGCCNKGPELLLVYEYMANSSLDKFLFGKRRGSLNWKQRYDIIMGTARGLAYLHEEFHVCIIHRDIKAGNILLDDDFQAKIADFGLARLLPEDQSHLNTRFAGTLGYMPPEYAIRGQLSAKVDIYSFGVVVLEIICGKKSSEVKNDLDDEYLLKRAWKLYENDKHQELVDETLDPNEYTIEEVKRIIEIALVCIQSSPALRPSMSEVVVLLKSKGLVEHQPPSKPAYVDSEKRIRGDASTLTTSSTSNAIVSTSQS